MGDSFTYFASYGRIKSLPNGKMSQYGAYWTMPAAFGGQTQQLAGLRRPARRRDQERNGQRLLRGHALGSH